VTVVGWLSATEAAERLGVKPATLYAYVSRGVLARRVGDDGRTSWFDPAVVDRVAARRRGNRRTVEGAVEVPLRTAITRISDEGVWFRGRALAGLVGRHRFEAIADLVITGELSDGDGWPPTRRSAIGVSDAGSPTDRMIEIVLREASFDLDRSDRSPLHVASVARHLIVASASGVPGSARRPLDKSVAALLAARVSPGPPTRPFTDVIDTALAIMVDHDLATSTLAARVAASTRADVYSTMVAALATLGGPLHGLASRATHEFFELAAQTSPDEAVTVTLADGGRLPGWGHRIYRDVDPRASLLLTALRRAGAPREPMALVERVRRAGAARVRVHPNVDFALAAMSYVYGLSPMVGEYVMGVSRLAGWAAHVIEEYDEAPLRFRPRARYVGR
jgi:citrate synthase